MSLKSIPLQPFYTQVELEDGLWWFRCPSCDHNIGIPRFDATSVTFEEDKKRRVGPVVTFPGKIVCEICESPMDLQRWVIASKTLVDDNNTQNSQV